MSTRDHVSSVWSWVRASRLASQSYIAPPLLLGQWLALPQVGALDWSILLWVQLFGLFDQLFIIYANDFADRETDALNQTATPFSGGSRVLAEGTLSPAQMLRASRWAAAATVGTSAVLAFAFGRPLALPLGLLALAMLWSYSYRPLMLSYRGGGELVQMIGVGLCLPLFGYYNQAGSLAAFPWPLLGVLLPTHLACAMATSLPDAPSDRASSKRTATVWLGARLNRALLVALNVGALVCLARVADSVGVAADAWLLGPPTLATAATALGPVGAPGSRLLTLRVALAIATTVSIVVGLLWALL